MTETEIKQAELAIIKTTIKEVADIDIELDPDKLEGEQLEYHRRSKLDLLKILLSRRKILIENEIKMAQKELDLTNSRILVFGDME